MGGKNKNALKNLDNEKSLKEKTDKDFWSKKFFRLNQIMPVTWKVFIQLFPGANNN